MTFLAVPAFNDLKVKSSKGGGFSDGGVRCERLTLTSQGVEVGPPPGVAYGGFNAAGNPLNANSVQAINFDTTTSVTVEEYFVREDGSALLTGSTPVGPNASTTNPALNESAVQSCSPFLNNGGILAFPNKLRYKLVAYGQLSLPTARVLLHFDTVEFDLPKDQEAD